MQDNRVRNRYNPEYFYNKALAHLELVSTEEAIAWYAHPCTKSLIMALEGDLAGLVVTMVSGAYIDAESSSGTAQSLAKAVGMSSAINDMLEHIEEVKSLKLEGENTNA